MGPSAFSVHSTGVLPPPETFLTNLIFVVLRVLVIWQVTFGVPAGMVILPPVTEMLLSQVHRLGS